MRKGQLTKSELIEAYIKRLAKHIQFTYSAEEIIAIFTPVINGEMSLNEWETYRIGEEVFDLVIPEPEDDVIKYAYYHPIVMMAMREVEKKKKKEKALSDGLSPEELPSGNSPDEVSPDVSPDEISPDVSPDTL